jgi:hypothetical protein
MSLPPLPPFIHQGLRRYTLNSGKDRYIAALAGIPYTPDPGPDHLISIKAFATAIGVSVRTIERRIAEERASLSALPAGDNMSEAV